MKFLNNRERGDPKTFRKKKKVNKKSPRNQKYSWHIKAVLDHRNNSSKILKEDDFTPKVYSHSNYQIQEKSKDIFNTYKYSKYLPPKHFLLGS